METGRSISIGAMISEIAGFTMDRGFSKGMSRPWYKSQVANAISEINMDTQYTTVEEDFSMPDKGILSLPDSMFAPSHVWVGEKDGKCCKVSTLKEVKYRRDFSIYNGEEASRLGQGLIEDEMYNKGAVRTQGLYCSEQNGQLHFSADCRLYSGIRVRAKGFGVNGDEIHIPEIFRQYVQDYVCEAFFRAKMADPSDMNRATYVQMWRVYNGQLNNMDGSKMDAQLRAKRASRLINNMLREQQSNIVAK